VNGAARPFERCSKQSRRLATRAISANSQADFHQHVITQTQEQAAIPKSGEACYYFHCIFKFASSLGQSDMFSLAGYSDMKSKLVASLR
jgi:hypothetical protein